MTDLAIVKKEKHTTMLAVLTRAGCFISIIIIGYTLRRIGFFKPEDFHVLAKIVLKITLPAAIIANFEGMEISPSLLTISLLGLGGGILYILLGFLLNMRSTRKQKAFDVLNMSGYNIGNFTMPFAQSFLGPAGVITTSLFDVGNAIICLGGAYAVANSVQNGETRISPVSILKTASKSIAFDTYIIMTVVCLLHISLPKPVYQLADIISGANAFLAMLMIGVGFKLSGDRSQFKSIFRILVTRYSVSIIMALVFYNLLPFAIEYRRALAVLCFAPIASAAPAFTADLKNDIGLSSAINSMSIIISIISIVTVLLIIL